jgi:hypothetical protein
MIVAERNREKRVAVRRIRKSIARLIAALEKELAEIDAEIDASVRGSPMAREGGPPRLRSGVGYRPHAHRRTARTRNPRRQEMLEVAARMGAVRLGEAAFAFLDPPFDPSRIILDQSRFSGEELVKLERDALIRGMACFKSKLKELECAGAWLPD